MALTDWITVAGIVVTLGATGYTLYLALKVKTIVTRLERKYRKLNLIDVLASLGEISTQASDLRVKLSTGNRGQTISLLTRPIHTSVAGALEMLPPTTPEKALRQLLSEARTALVNVENCPPADRSKTNEQFVELITDAAATCRQSIQSAESHEI